MEWFTKYLKKHPDPPITIMVGGALTREGAAHDARVLWGDLGTISGDDNLPRLVWCIGQFDRTVGRGRTWEIALQRAKARKAKLDAKALAKARAEAQLMEVQQ